MWLQTEPCGFCSCPRACTTGFWVGGLRLETSGCPGCSGKAWWSPTRRECKGTGSPWRCASPPCGPQEERRGDPGHPFQTLWALWAVMVLALSMRLRAWNMLGELTSELRPGPAARSCWALMPARARLGPHILPCWSLCLSTSTLLRPHCGSSAPPLHSHPSWRGSEPPEWCENRSHFPGTSALSPAENREGEEQSGKSVGVSGTNSFCFRGPRGCLVPGPCCQGAGDLGEQRAVVGRGTLRVSASAL